MRILLLASVLGLFACQGANLNSNTPNIVPAKGPQLVNKAECAAKKGKIVHGRVGEVCASPTRDAGKVCTSGSTCEALCMVNTDGSGSCSAYKSNFGCHDVLTGGKKSTICID